MTHRYFDGLHEAVSVETIPAEPGWKVPFNGEPTPVIAWSVYYHANDDPDVYAVTPLGQKSSLEAYRDGVYCKHCGATP